MLGEHTDPGALYHTRQRGWIAGVCVGVADHLDLAVWVVRLLFVILVIAGPGALLYGLLWAITPDEREL